MQQMSHPYCWHDKMSVSALKCYAPQSTVMMIIAGDMAACTGYCSVNMTLQHACQLSTWMSRSPSAHLKKSTHGRCGLYYATVVSKFINDVHGVTAASSEQKMSFITMIVRAEPYLETLSDQSHPILHTVCYTWEVRCARYFLHGR